MNGNSGDSAYPRCIEFLRHGASIPVLPVFVASVPKCRARAPGRVNSNASGLGLIGGKAQKSVEKHAPPPRLWRPSRTLAEPKGTAGK
jgi:hypothetical protein